MIIAITDKYRSLLNRDRKSSFSDVAYDYLMDNGYDDDDEQSIWVIILKIHLIK